MRSVTAVAADASVGVELLQLTGLPASASAAFPPAAWVLGSTFAATDLLGYLAGGVVGLVLLRVLRHRRRLSSRRPARARAARRSTACR